MEGTKQLFDTMGIVVGGIALILAQFHFWAGPLAPQPTMDSYVAEKAAALRQKTLAALSGKDLETDFISTSYNADQIANILTALFGGIACILGVFSFARKESIRFSGGAVALGVSAIIFQFLTMYAMALLVVILITAVLSSLGG